VTAASQQAFSLRFSVRTAGVSKAAGWCFIGLNSLLMNTGLASEAEQFDWLASQLSAVGGKPLALFLHKPLYLKRADDPELAATAIRYIPQPARSRLIEMFAGVDLRLVASATSTSAAILPATRQACLGAFIRLHHSRSAAGSDRNQGGRAR